MKCQVEIEAKLAADQATNLVKSLRKLRRTMRQCRDCPEGESCAFLIQFHNTIQNAIEQVVDEWGL